MVTQKTDLHCHILPGIDDGAKNLEVSIALLREEINQGVTNIMFTPHFDSDRISVDEFVSARGEALEQLRASKEFAGMDINFKLGAEVYYTVGLADMELEPLCYQGSDYILIELPTQARPHGLSRTLGTIINKGYRPIIAHVERYAYMMSDPTTLYDLIDLGCLAQINAETLVTKTKLSPVVGCLIRRGLVQFIASDCHSRRRRPPNLEKGFAALRSNYGEKYEARFLDAAKQIYSGAAICPEDAKKPKKILGMWV